MADEIDIGAAAINRTFAIDHHTVIETSNPANLAGALHTVLLYPETLMSGIRVCTCYAVGGGRYTTRDWEAVANQAAGYREIAVDLDVEIGDFIAVSYTGGSLSRDSGLGTNILTKSPPADIPFADWLPDNIYDMTVSLGGIGNLPVPIVTTQAVSDITKTSAIGNGNITDIGGDTPTKRGVCWNTTGNPTVADSKSEEEGSFGTGAFTRPMGGLSPGQHYYVKAYAYNPLGYGYGAQVEFSAAVSGDIAKSVLDTLIIEDSAHGALPSVLHIRGNVYAVAYAATPPLGAERPGRIKTFSVDSEGNFGGVLAELEFDAASTTGMYLQLIRISGTTYAIAHNASAPPRNVGKIRTLTISDDGLTISAIDSWGPEIQGDSAKSMIAHVAGTVYAFCYSRAVAPGGEKLITLNIANNGTITKSAIDYFDFGAVTGGNVFFFKRVVGNYFLMCGDWPSGIARTVEISDAGSIADAVVDLYGFAGVISWVSIIELSPGYYCAVYQGVPGGGGNMVTFSVDASGDISTEIQRENYDPNGFDPMVTTVGDRMRAIVFRGVGQTDGTIYTYDIDNEGIITMPYQDAWTFDTSWAACPYLIQISGPIWMIVYKHVSAPTMKAITFSMESVLAKSQAYVIG